MPEVFKPRCRWFCPVHRPRGQKGDLAPFLSTPIYVVLPGNYVRRFAPSVLGKP